MSQVTQPRITLPSMVRTRRSVWLGALLVLVAGAAVVLILALGTESSENVAPGGAQPSPRTHGGLEESHVAAAVGSRPATGADEATVASSIASTEPQVSSGPDESRIAAAVGASSQPSSSGPDESRIAAAISGR
jgi:hypothetical protein